MEKQESMDEIDPLYEYRRRQNARFLKLQEEENRRGDQSSEIEATTAHPIANSQRAATRSSEGLHHPLALESQEDEAKTREALIASDEAYCRALMEQETEGRYDETGYGGGSDYGVRPPLRTGYVERLIDPPSSFNLLSTRRLLNPDGENYASREENAISQWITSPRCCKSLLFCLGAAGGIVVLVLIVSQFLTGTPA